MAPQKTLLGLVLGLGLFLLASAAPERAEAQCCEPPPPVCCTPPTPPVCCTPPPVATGLIQGLNVEGSRKKKRVAYEASRTRTRRVVIQAVCIDARQTPHPASQVFPEREVEDLYDGELYRCLAGAWLQATIAEFSGQIDFSGGQTLVCGKDEALYHAPGGQVTCRPQKPARDCNERSLLRRFGAGVKILTMTSSETYTAYREEEEVSESSSAMALSLDGGVGGTAY